MASKETSLTLMATGAVAVVGAVAAGGVVAAVGSVFAAGVAEGSSNRGVGEGERLGLAPPPSP